MVLKRHISLCPAGAVVTLILHYLISNAKAELTPPYFNLATGRKIYATATCGMDTDGPELYCKLVGANTENDHIDYSVIQGQVCDYCDPTIPEKNHAPEHAIDGTESWWQSPPLSRGMKFNEVNLTIDFGQEFHVAYLFIRMGNSPRPGLWTLEKSSDYGKTWSPWQHFSDTPADCETYFGKDTYKPINNDDDVICTTEYSKIVPLENGEIPVMLLNDRPSATNYFNSSILQEWTRATNVRIRLLRTKNLLGHLMSVARQDPTVTRRYFYSIKDISIGGRCMCNGHADTCDVKDPKSPVRILACRCQHHTCGIQCNECCPGFEAKKWRQNTNARPFECEPCNCHGHTNDCIYDEDVDRKRLSLDVHGRYEGGGRCLNCQHNTEGINCNKCKPKYYRSVGKYWNETDVCQPCRCDYFYSTGNCMEESGICECRKAFQPPNCDTCAYGYYGYPNCRECECNLNGTDGYHCEAINGECPCKINFAGHYCKQCADGYYSFPECKACECNKIGSISNDCDLVTGQCKCLSSFGGERCERCKHGYYRYPKCQYCDCDIQGTEEEICDKDNGQCICREGFGGPRCDQCLPGYYNYPACKTCNCSATGSTAITCDNTGKCNCLTNFASKQCTLCSAGYFSYPECLPCNCDVHGSEGVTCNADGQCLCLPNFDGKLCDSCKEGFYNFPSCEDCNCDPAGVIDKFAGCGSVPVGELCQCKERVTGRICNECMPLYWNLNISNPDGCEICDCWTDGTIGSVDTCDSKTGQCTCKPHTNGRTCKYCKDGTYDLDGATLFGCKDCNCDVGGSWKSECDKLTGQCKCHPRVTGRACTQPLTTHYFPTLHQFQYEYENGYQPSGAQVRYQFDESVFPGFSNKGYAVFNDIQNEVRNELTVFKSSVYRIVIRYVNQNTFNVTASILIQSENPLEVDQNVKVLLRPTATPQFVTVAGDKGKKPSAIVLDPGRYTFITKCNKNVMLDYFVLLPAAYYEASILTRKIATPCELGNMELCRHYKYASVEDLQPAIVPFIVNANGKPTNPNEFYNDPEHLTIVNHIGDIPLITFSQPKLNYIVDVPHSGRYIFVVDYVSDRNYAEPVFIKLRIDDGDDDQENYGTTTMYPCLFSMACRTPIIDEQTREKVYTLSKEDSKPVVVYADFDDNERVAIISITAIPAEEWSVDYIIPNPVCVINNGQCATPKFRTVPDSKKIEFETDHEDHITFNKPPYAVLDERVKLIYLDSKEDATIVIESRVAEARHYVILVKYYQPYHPKFNVLYTLTAGKNQYDGKFEINHCPSSSGCRGVLRPSGDEWTFDIEDDFKFTVTNNRPSGVWLDYLIVVPVDQYSDDLLIEETFDQTKEFIQECGQDHFYITHNASDFCKKAVFSLTADYNGGALPCNCDYAGSTSFECHPFGGQCQCKPNIINRQCGACRTGYYGFPDCKPCSCPSTATCEPHTGDCVCPPNVMGENCDKCAPNTYGYHQIIGCEDCNCNRLGVALGNTQCDMLNGLCECREHIEGRACDTCSNGYFDFPRCDQCSCNVDGTELEICDKVDGACFCKKNVVGRDCDLCMDGTYNLQYNNPDGCTACFCFGKTSRCESAYLRVFNVSLLKNVSLNTANFTDKFIDFAIWDIPADELLVNETMLQADFSFADINDESIVYFGVLDYLAGQNSHISAYGGELAYTLFYSTGFSGKPLIAPDVILFSKDHVLIHQSYEQPSSNQVFKNRVHMVESNFLSQDGKVINRADFMMALRNINMIYIRANYWEQTLISQLSEVYLTLADESDDDSQDGYEFLPVEKCHCPPGYTGLSCEDCAPGYYRDPNGPYGGYCIPCECNGHADTCDCVTGICEDCTHFTTGDHCDMCIEGYYGNATFGSPHDCMICACPLPIPGNNFAVGCEISDAGNEIHCDCKAGYTGARCDFCSNGFYGHPQTPGDYCKPCQCSGNINPEEPGSCDTLTGECLRCLNNTFGTACNLCAPGFYGDAVKLKNCQSCDCEDLGTLECDPFVGVCKCHGNVIGKRCDRCETDHYGYDSGLGCRSCDCGIASNSTQCDEHTGKCACKPGVTGRQCDRCAVDHWKYTTSGCTPCNCNKGYSRGFGCNALTGQCECLPGVIGDRCDACPHRWVLRKGEGCFECDACHHALLDVTDRLRYEIDPVMDEFQSVALAFFTSQKLNYYDELAEKVAPEVQSLDPKSVNLDPSRSAVSELEAEAKMYLKQVNLTIDNAEDSRDMAGVLLTNVSGLREQVALSTNEARDAIASVEILSRNLETAASTKIDSALTEAQELLSQINATSIDLENNVSILQKATELLSEISTIIQPVKSQNKSLNGLKNDIGEFSDKLEDLYDWSLEAANKSAEVERLNVLNKMAFENSKFDTVADQKKEAEKNIKDAYNLYTNGDIALTEIAEKIGDLGKVLHTLKDVNKQIDLDLPEIENEYFEASNMTLQAELKGAELTVRAQDLTEQYADMTASAEPAIKAARAYSDIVDAVSSAREFTKKSKYAAGNATEKTFGIEDRAGAADKESAELLQRARASLHKVQSDLEPRLNASSAKVESISMLNENTENRLKDINIAMEALPAESQRDMYKSSNQNASDALDIMKDVLDILEPVVKQTTKELDQARNISKDIDLTNKDINQVQNHLDSVETFLPELTIMADSLGEQQAKVEMVGQELGDEIEGLRRQIETARQIANDIKVGVKFVPSTILELKTPETLPLLATKTKVSTHFKTDNPNGFLLFLGNDNKTAANAVAPTKNDDFMALEIVNGYPILTLDLGNGPERITNEKYVADGEWYQAIVDRTGSNVKLIIREQLDDGSVIDHVKEEALMGANNVFNVDRNSRLFVGGYPPPSDFTPPEDIHSSSFVGEIDDLRVGDEEVGLWNFVYGEDNNQGAQKRKKLLSKDIPPTGYRFNGNGYVVLKATPYNFKTRSSIQFSFKAAKDAKNGLLFFYGRNSHFMSIELIDGTVFFRYKLGEHIVSTGSNDKYNDDEWHRVVAERDGRRGVLKVDDVQIFQEEAPPQADDTMPVFKRMFFGGFPGKRNHSIIVEENFDGCIDDVTISGNKVDLSEHVNAVGAKPGCPKKFSTILSYPPHEFGFLRTANLSSNNNLNINLKFKTRQKNGVLFYGTNQNQSSTISLSMEDGYLTLRSMGSELESNARILNDGEEHVVTVLHDGNQLRLSIDDMEDKRLPYPPEPLYIDMGDIFFGGLPENIKIPRDALANLAYFLGCISDVTVNGEIINFADSIEKKNGNINSCSNDIFSYDITAVPIYYPDGENELFIPKGEEDRPSFISRPKQLSTTTPTAITTTTTEFPMFVLKTVAPTTTFVTTTTTSTQKPSIVPDFREFDEDHGPITRRPLLWPDLNKPADPRCKLPINPNYDVDFIEAGYRFFSVREQRLEIPSLSAKIRRHYAVTFSFRTDYHEGLLFYASDKYHTDYIAVFLSEGRIHHQVHLGSLVANISSAEELNDGQWHTVQFLRNNRKVSLFIDDVEQTPMIELEDKSPRGIVVEFPIYLGGVPKYVEESVRQNIEDIRNTSYYNGCLKDIKVNGAALEKEPIIYHVVPCSEQIEPGYFFNKPTGYVKLFDRFTVGTDFSLSFDFRPRDPDGLLFSVHGKNTYMILELIDNRLWFTVKSDSKNIVSTNYTLPDNGSYCDGKWRNVQAVKSKFVITISVDYYSAKPGVGTEGSTTTKTNRPLFLGGHQAFNKAPGLKTKKTFKGCIGNIQVNKKPVRISPNLVNGEIWQGACPLG
ncbi:laminin subunit alpha [Glossina fuscipes]|uniref:Laminin A chain n=1 Tax=Glossina fuscipes TaxID=7396 RepID=A0A9C6E1Y5_9MUSC|nr:laminin subunit alpha [Glossina fuscipes]